MRPPPFEPELISYDNAVQAEYDAMHETEADRQFIASAKLLAALPKKQNRFSWAGVVALLAVAAGVMWLAYSFVEGW